MQCKKILKSKRGEGYIDVVVLVLCAMLVIALAVKVLPAYIYKQQLDTFATELAREASIQGQTNGTAVARREQVLRDKTGLNPTITWSTNGRVGLNAEFTVTLTMRYDIGFGGLGSFPITLRAVATGKSEVYWSATRS